MERAPCVTVGNDTIKTNLVEVGCLELQHLVDTCTVNGISSLANFLVITLTAEAGSDQLLAVLVKKIERGLVSTCRDLDQLGKAVSNLRFGQGLQERKVQESVDGSVISTQPVLVVAVVDSNLDTDTGVDEANDGGGNTDEICVPAVRGTRESTNVVLVLP